MNFITKNAVMVAVLIVVVIGVIGGVWFMQHQQPSVNYDTFAQCIKDSGAQFYGAFWCPHCQEQKALFGNAEKNLPYIECSTPDTNGQLQVCIDEKITVYPTWKFKDGTIHEGDMSLQELADQTKCVLPTK